MRCGVPAMKDEMLKGVAIGGTQDGRILTGNPGHDLRFARPVETPSLFVKNPMPPEQNETIKYDLYNWVRGIHTDQVGFDFWLLQGLTVDDAILRIMTRYMK